MTSSTTRFAATRRLRCTLSRRATSSQRLDRRDIAEFEVPAPPLAEQRRIADILDKADVIRRKRKEAMPSPRIYCARRSWRCSATR